MRFVDRGAYALVLVGLQLLGTGCGGLAVDGDARNEITLEGSVARPSDGDDDGTYLLRAGVGQTFALHFGETPELQSGERLRIRGKREEGSAVFSVSGWERLEAETGALRAALTGNVGRTARVLALVTHFPGTVTEEEDEEARDTLLARMFGELSAAKVFDQSSYGLLELAGSAVAGIEIPDHRSEPGWNGCALASRLQMTNEAETAASQQYDLSGFDHHMVVLPHLTECTYHGQANPSGAPLLSWFNGMPSCGTISHELLHNLGAKHASGYECGAQTLSDPSGCSNFSDYGDILKPRYEYGHSYDPMGRSRCIQFGAETRRQQQWLGACNVVDVRANATFELVPLDAPSNAIQMLRVPLPAERCPLGLTYGGVPGPCYLSVEYRQPLGSLESNPVQDPRIFAGVVLSTGLAPTDGSKVSPYLLDMTPRSLSALYDAQLLPGVEFSDSGIKVKLLSKNASRALVKVTVPTQGTTTCSDGTTPIPAPAAPASCWDGVFNGTETGANCGGSSCWPCPDGQGCITNSDCHSDRCILGGCQPRLPTCSDGLKNGNETDRDCGGGTCGTCAEKQACSLNSDCRGGQCVGGACQLPSSCANGGAPSSGESDVDCGGSICNLCERDKACNINADCYSNNCVNGKCTT